MSKAPSINPNTVSTEAIPVYQIMNRVNRVIPGTHFEICKLMRRWPIEMTALKSDYRPCAYQLRFAWVAAGIEESPERMKEKN